MNLKKYQLDAITKLIVRSSELLTKGSNRKIIFQAPTGSGKTIIIAQLLSEMTTDPSFKNESFSFIWAAPRKLHHQSKKKLTTYYKQSHQLNCSEFFELNDNKIDENEILFLNWESINKIESNTIVKENEKEFYLKKVVENTIEDGRKIILIIDESHHHASSEISKQLIFDMSPHLTIEVSATPTLENPDEIVRIELGDVRAEGMIKKSISLNEGSKNLLLQNKIDSKLSATQDATVLKQALAKRLELLNFYKSNGSDVNPLLLIQLPDKKATEDEVLRNELVKMLKNDYDIGTENGKLAIYLSEEKENLENIAKNNNETEVLIFKQAIALGWDCPRAQILVLFREHKSVAFSIQTVGRILRMPEPEYGHYSEEELNKAYVFTNISDITINEEMAKGYITIHTSKRIESYKDINLTSCYRLRQRERTRLNSEFNSIFLKVAEDYDLKSKLLLENQFVERGLISDASISDVDQLRNTVIQSNFSVVIQNDMDLQKIFDSFIRKNLEPFHPEDRSIGRLKESIYGFFAISVGMEYSSDQVNIINIALSELNVKHVTNVIDQAKEMYIALVDEREKELVQVLDWNIPRSLNFTSNETLIDVNKSVMVPFYTSTSFRTELAFIKFLEENNEVEWWFKNGERDATFFAIPYIENGESKPFYVDFIIKMNDGRIAILDTKRGQTVKTSIEKSDGLQAFIMGSEKFFGGIVDNTKHDFTGRWMVYTGKSSDLIAGDFTNWELLELD